jgi:hypothetical protein
MFARRRELYCGDKIAVTNVDTTPTFWLTSIYPRGEAFIAPKAKTQPERLARDPGRRIATRCEHAITPPLPLKARIR